MRTNILTSMFPKGFPDWFVKQLEKRISKREHLVMVASEFEKNQDMTDYYSKMFADMFQEAGIGFEHIHIVDSRMTKKEMKDTIQLADVLWLSGGDTPVQYDYFRKYELIPVIQEYDGIVIGMSAGAINMGKTAVCSLTCQHTEQTIYEGLGLVDISVEPHLDSQNVSQELLEVSKKYSLYGMCDDSVIINENHNLTYFGDIFLIENGVIKQLSKA